jgi:hypothetical protein
MPLRLWQEVQALPRCAGRHIALSRGNRNPLCKSTGASSNLRRSFGRFDFFDQSGMRQLMEESLNQTRAIVDGFLATAP